ncbi:2-succinyl-5-enolpyruvyl-6-hydroxy-3-cyclohexene-1-carboxylic-acid synthase [Lysinibacillus sp. 2017]|uniref:2-succinyl-5-enolpyruvyl-6-hydroxy-3- cyclohexene-1-carboxylic-acid synthase n=1 Tax=unclassified Lysinibacillus TaxID=2636778 RepID=UPI000D525CC2|nr:MULTISPECIES: 2-succinyl-5-enolpyruvyl-6-hydroxy-3-cyclohexene-1-carboxylic-acid synthase [unclassified Lysinibacillus]AWE08417.1 2-succinyl-5-enolpyruvyl-6-hydroxy-3-cyclohexene-1-carboxylic-acid synthase [Lysinibacillus sp. 2017]TGN35736.1 2-succinyl-5-enolpyruvyl-6-hydroxy-3-cyclohexene-1-carboxylic-acid synthase [Lysinibacillus sp. S2017]
MNERGILTNYVYKIVSTLVQSGVQNVVVSPGSRSTPLAYAFASTKELAMHRQVDERAAAFYALGLAKSTAKPVVLLCTSGTAAANYFPAIVEAKYARVPLIVLTADRPHELREVGAPQTINQVRLYGENVKWSAEFPIPDDALQTLPYIEHHTVRAVNIATTAPFGPVHLNIPFREPLLIDFNEQLPKAHFVKSYMNELVPSKQAMMELKEIIEHTKNGIIVVGELPLGTNTEHLWDFIREVKWPVMMESLSNLRTEVPEDCQALAITTYDALMKNERFKRNVRPQTVIRFGAQPVSKFLMQFITQSKPQNYMIIDEDPMFRDSTHVSTHFIHALPGAWLSDIKIEHTVAEMAYVEFWKMADLLAINEIEKYAEHASDEGAMVQAMLASLPEGSDIFVSSSMPIRDIDTFLTTTNKNVQVFANRGANGIDGVTSTALGFSQGRKTRKTYLFIGDLAFLHDANAFIATRYQTCNLTIVVMNNDGGGIFSYLPQSKIEAHYEDLFGTPTALTFEKLASMYDMDYATATSSEEFSSALQASKHADVKLIEVFTNREDNVREHQALWTRIQEVLEQWLDMY